MPEGMGIERTAEVGSVDRLTPDDFIEAQYRKTELRRRSLDNDAADHVSKLMRAIEQDVIPRLVSAKSSAKVSSRATRQAAATDWARVAHFAQILLGHQRGVEPRSYIEEVRADGSSVEAIYLDLLAPAARQIGALWDEDLCTFIDVTLALGTLHSIMIALSDDFRDEHLGIDRARRVLLVQTAGSTHTFGLQMVAEFFRRGAWSVDMASASTKAMLQATVRADWFTVIGFSLACESGFDDLVQTIRLVRRASANPAVGILVGGPALVTHPELVGRLGADRTAVDAFQAVLEAERFVLYTGSDARPLS